MHKSIIIGAHVIYEENTNLHAQVNKYTSYEVILLCSINCFFFYFQTQSPMFENKIVIQHCE